jgi:hypothetical protein
VAWRLPHRDLDLDPDPDKQWPAEQQRERELLARSQQQRDRARAEMDRLRSVIENLSCALERATIDMLARRRPTADEQRTQKGKKEP